MRWKRRCSNCRRTGCKRIASCRVPPRGPCMLSFAQERIWFMGLMSSESALYNTGNAVHLRGPLDVDALERAINALVQRHEVLRCSITVVDGQPWQRFRERVENQCGQEEPSRFCANPINEPLYTGLSCPK